MLTRIDRSSKSILIWIKQSMITKCKRFQKGSLFINGLTLMGMIYARESRRPDCPLDISNVSARPLFHSKIDWSETNLRRFCVKAYSHLMVVKAISILVWNWVVTVSAMSLTLLGANTRDRSTSFPLSFCVRCSPVLHRSSKVRLAAHSATHFTIQSTEFSRDTQSWQCCQLCITS